MGDQLELATKQKKAVAQKNSNKPVGFESLIAMAMKKENGIEIIKELSKLQNEQEDRLCKKEFDFHFAEMQKEFTPIARTKKGQFGLYAPLEKMTEKYGPIITRHGFSYWWEPEKEQVIITEKPHKRTYLVIAGYGHERRKSFFDAPEVKTNAATSEIQTCGIQDTYSHRYTFKAGFGIAEIDEDTDGNLKYEDGITYANEVNLIRTCKTKKELSDTFTLLYKQFTTDKIGRELISIEKDKMKKVLNI